MEWLDGLIVFWWLVLDAVFIAGTLFIAGAIWVFGEFYKVLIGAKLADEFGDEEAPSRHSHT